GSPGSRETAESDMTTIRRLLYPVSYLLVLLLKPFKLCAWRSGSPLLRRIVIALTTPIDFSLIWLNVQNETMLLHWRVYGGNFIFGRALMVVDYATAAGAITQPLMKNSN